MKKTGYSAAQKRKASASLAKPMYPNGMKVSYDKNGNPRDQYGENLGRYLPKKKPKKKRA